MSDEEDTTIDICGLREQIMENVSFIFPTVTINNEVISTGRNPRSDLALIVARDFSPGDQHIVWFIARIVRRSDAVVLMSGAANRYIGWALVNLFKETAKKVARILKKENGKVMTDGVVVGQAATTNGEARNGRR